MRTNIVYGKNTARIIGTIVEVPAFEHTSFGGNFYRTIVSVIGKNGSNLLPVKIPESLMSEDIKYGQKVDVRGVCRSYREHIKERNRRHVFILAKNIRIAKDKENDKYINNRINLQGMVCCLPIHRLTPMGRDITDLLIAVNRPNHRSDYIPCIVWGEDSLKAKDLKVGATVSIYGRMQSRMYMPRHDKKDPEVVTVYEVSAIRLKEENQGVRHV